jgi:hypothetical protein
MFEIVGLLTGIALLFALSIALGLVYALVAWIIAGRSGVRRWIKILVAFCIPPASAVYLLICAVGIATFAPDQGGFLFGDIYEPLPNGYALKALGKMPDYGNIQFIANPKIQPNLTAWVGQLDVSGSLVFGAYSHAYSIESSGDHLGYFALDTKSNQARDFATESELNEFAGHPVHLVDNALFRSTEAWYQRRIKIENYLSFGPPIILTFLYFTFLIWLRKPIHAEQMLKSSTGD